MKTILRSLAAFIFTALFLAPGTVYCQKYWRKYVVAGPLPNYVLPTPDIQQCRQWTKSYGNSNHARLNAMQPTSDGGFIMAGTTVISSKNRVLLVKTDANGTEQWRKTYGGSGSNSIEAYSIQQTANGEYILAGYTQYPVGQFADDKDFWILKTDATGNVQWEKTFGGSSYEEAYAIALTNDNGYIVAGMTSSTDGDVDEEPWGSNRYWVVKLKSNGDLDWKKKLEAQMRPYSIRQTSDNGYILAGDSYTYFNQQTGLNHESSFFVLKLNISGDFQWEVSLANDDGSGAFDVIQAGDGNYVAAGFITSHTPLYNDGNGLVVKINPSGNVMWQTQVDFSMSDEIRSIRETGDGGFIFGGNTDYSWNNHYSGTYDESDFWAGRLNPGGQLLWQGALGSSRMDDTRAIAPTSDGSYAIAGTTTNSTGYWDYTLIKLEPGCTIQQTNGRYRLKKNIQYATTGSPEGRKSSVRSGEEESTTAVFRDELDRIMATVTSAGDSPLGGGVTTTAWVDLDQSPRYVKRHYEIMPDNDAATATGTVTLYFAQGDFDSYNDIVSDDKKLPINPGDAAGKANLRIVKYSGISSNDDGLPESYSTRSTVINPDDLHIVWNSSQEIWEVTFDVTGFSGFFATDAITSDSPLPVTFTKIEAFIKEGILTVNWTVGSETSNAYYLVETSEDGKNFKVVSNKILSGAQNGDSSATLKYSFIKSYSLLHSMAALLVLIAGLGRKNRKAAACIAAIGCLAFTLSCKELTTDIESRNDKKLYVRIVQVDEDGSRNYSRIVTAQP